MTAKDFKTFLKKQLLLVVAAGMIIFMVISVLSHPKPELTKPAYVPAISPFKEAISGTGVIEAQSEDISIGTAIPGVVTTIYISVGQKVKQGEPLFTIDDRDAKARLAAAKAKYESAEASLNEAKHQLALYESVKDPRAISQDELIRRQDAVKVNQARLAETEADREVTATEVDRLTVKAPIDGTILKSSLNPGEYAQAGNVDPPLLVLGNIDTLYVRVEVDETNALGISPQSRAIGFLRGYGKNPIPLSFVKFEPLMVGKKFISPNNNEQIDTRVMQILYSFDNTHLNAHVGQQMDVYIEHAK